MRNVSDRGCIEYQNTCSITFFSSKNRAVYEIMWKRFVEPDGPQMPIWRMSIAYWIPKATNTDSEFVALIAFSTATVARTHLSVRLYVHRLSFYFWD